VLAGTKSGSGKTTLTLGLLAALKRRGLQVAPFKVGPDFIDPGHHTAVTGRESRNLDGWMLPRAYNLDSFAQNTRDADIAVVEGVMGLFDGYDGKSEAGSTAQMAKWLGLPVLLIVDARSMARSAAALVQGFERFDADLTFAGVVFNMIGSRRHLDYLEQALAGNTAMPFLGGLNRDEKISVPERHLGLFTREDHAFSPEELLVLSDMIEDSIHLDRLLENLPEIVPRGGPASPAKAPAAPSAVRIGVARDRAFCFYYPDNLELLKARGAEVIAFSPIDDTVLPDNLDGLYLGGGYPELSAVELTGNVSMRQQILEKSRQGMPIYSECGGFMYLCREIIDNRGEPFPMVGCFPFRTRMHTKLKSLGYREITLAAPSVIGPAGLCIRGHEFHYSGIEPDREQNDVETMFSVSARAGIRQHPTGYVTGRTLGSYIHLHFGSQPEAAGYFVENCLTYQRERTTIS